MKKILFICLLLPAFSFAQCKFDVNNYDPFLKTYKKEKEVKISGRYSGLLKLDFCQYGSTVFFRLKAGFDDPAVVGKNDAFIFLLKDGTIIKAYPDQIYSGDINVAVSFGMVVHSSTLDATYYFENESDFKKLQKIQVKTVRLYYNDVYQENEIKSKYADDLFKTVQCF